jgi:hypothetical protein
VLLQENQDVPEAVADAREYHAHPEYENANVLNAHDDLEDLYADFEQPDHPGIHYEDSDEEGIHQELELEMDESDNPDNAIVSIIVFGLDESHLLTTEPSSVARSHRRGDRPREH